MGLGATQDELIEAMWVAAMMSAAATLRGHSPHYIIWGWHCHWLGRAYYDFFDYVWATPTMTSGPTAYDDVY